ncbi:MAG: tetratricopeptide repeat protein [Hyphomicrobiales bacterium]
MAWMAIAIFMLSIVFSPISASAQEVVAADIKTEVKRGFGRFSITLPKRTRFIDYDVSTEDNIIVLRLSKAITVDLNRAVLPLSDYVLIARKDPEGSVLRFALAPGVRVNTQAAGEHLYLDFLPGNWRGENPGIPKKVVRKLERRAEAALALAEQKLLLSNEIAEKAKMDVRVGRHPIFTRFVFSWNVPYSTSFKREDNTAILVFDKLSAFDFSSINADLPQLVSRVEHELGADTTTVTLGLEEAAELRSYVDGNEYIVDVTNNKLRKDAEDQNSQIEVPFVLGGLPQLPETAKNVSQIVFPENNERAVAELPTAPIKIEEKLVEPSGADVDKEKTEQSQKKPLDVKRDDKPANDAGQKNKNGTTDITRSNPEHVDEIIKKVNGLSVVEASVNESQDALRLVFPFDKVTGSSVFRRGKSIWMVFKTDDVIDVSAIDALRGEFVRSVDIIENGEYKAVKINLPSAQLASAAIDNHNWTVSIGNAVIRPTKPLTASRRLADKGIFLSVPLEGAVGNVLFEDPDVGDHIHVVVAEAPARGLIRQQQFVMVTILPSTHALAFIPKNDSIKVHIEEDGVAIVSEKSLNLSAIEGLRASASGKLITDEWFDKALEIKDRDVAPDGQFGKWESRLIKDIVDAKETERPQYHVKLAEFYTANGYGPEALASLGRALHAQPLLQNKRAYILPKAAAELTMARYKDALKTLSNESYQKDPDAAIWRTIAAAGDGKWQQALKNATLGRTRLSSYDTKTQQDFFLSAADAALQVKDLDNAKGFLGALILRNASQYHLGRYEILQGILAIEEGRTEDARFFYERALNIDDSRIQARAKLRLIGLDYDTKAVDNAATIEAYEKFVAVWRNDDLELKGLRGLGKVLADEEEYRRAFQLVQTAVISDNDSLITHALQDDMKEVFVRLFHGGKADDLPPVEVLSLYYDFKHLTPIGRVGDEIVRYLSRRLIDIDLLPQASELLTHQVDKRLKGPARARVAADLAVVELLDNKPHRAITTLHKSRTAGLSVSLERQRRLVEAYAHSEVGKYDIALELLDSLDGEDVDRLRANINWDARRWSAAGELLEKTHSGRWSDLEPLSANVRLDIMRAAIAFSLGKDDFALNRLNRKFGQKMSESADAGVFQVLTQPLNEQSFDRDVAVDSILNISTADSFLRDYRHRYLSDGVRSSNI